MATLQVPVDDTLKTQSDSPFFNLTCVISSYDYICSCKKNTTYEHIYLQQTV